MNEPKQCPFDNDHSVIEPHVCAYLSDVDGDYETLCRCCDSCERECAADI